MPLTGELEHLPIVDVIQLIHSTRKSGTLRVFSRKGEGSLVFNNGYIVGASHSDEKLKIGQILLESGFVTNEQLNAALHTQNSSRKDRKPLITTLIETSNLSEKNAFQALEKLIEMTVVEMISWAHGIFSLEVDQINVCDDFKYLPAQLQELTLDTQMVLLDALRIFDEKMHAGEISIDDEPYEHQEDLTQVSLSAEIEDDNQDGMELTEDILGLADLDKIEHKKPRVFQGLEAFDPTEIHRQLISKTLPDIDVAKQERLVSFLSEFSISGDDSSPTNRSQAIIMYTADEFIRHAVQTVCKKEGTLVFMTDSPEEIDNLIERAQNRLLDPILIFGGPEEQSQNYNSEVITEIRQEKMRLFPQVSVIQIASPQDFAFSLQALNQGVRAVLPKPYPNERQETFVDDTIGFLTTFHSYVRACFNEERRQQFAKLRNSLSGLRLLNKAPDISLSVLQFVGEFFERSLTLIVDKTDLIAERSIGIISDKFQGPSAPLKIRIPFLEKSLFRDQVHSPQTYYGPGQDPVLEGFLYPEIVAPNESKILLLPLVSNDRLITLTYADFGTKRISQVPLDFIEFFASQAGISMENALFRRQLDKKPQSGYEQ